jgi:hypothetical protein
LALNRQQTGGQNRRGIKEQPDKPYQTNEELINEFPKVHDNHDLKISDQFKKSQVP